jgi:hypothetical protein
MVARSETAVRWHEDGHPMARRRWAGGSGSRATIPRHSSNRGIVVWCQTGFGAVPLNFRSNESATLVAAAKVVGARRPLAPRVDSHPMG